LLAQNAPAAPAAMTAGGLSGSELEQAFWMCDYIGTTQSVDGATAVACVTITDELKVKRFDGDFDALLAWWRSNKPAAHRAMEISLRNTRGLGAAALPLR
jgi:hypothetical protein